MMKPALIAAALLAASAAQAQDAYPKKIPAPGGHALIPIPQAQRAYDEYHFAPARRAGDFLYISGVIVAPRPGEARDAEGLKAQSRRVFEILKRTLEAEGLSFADVAMINTFHVWDGPGFTGTRDEQFAAFSAAKDEFMPPPHPAWTAVGTSGLLADNGVIEVQMIAYALRKR